MKFLLLILSVVLLWNLSEASPWGVWPRPPTRESTLRLVHLLFRHGNRNPEQSSIWEGNPFRDETYYPEGFGQLTNAGKVTEYNLGKFLRTRYDSFLGDNWNINNVDFRSSDYNRTKMSGLLVLAGLYPPRGDNVWSELPWQPIPYNYAPVTNDPLLFPLYCPTFATAFAEAYGSPEIQSYLTGRYSEALQIVSENTGAAANDFYAASGYFDAMRVQLQLGYPLDDWTSQVYPEPLHSLAVDMYYIWTNTTTLRRILAGNLVKKVLEDSQSAADGTLTPSTRKLFVYSAHDLNVGSVILSLDAYKIQQTPPYGSTVIFEVHEIRGVWGLKLFYIDYNDGSPHPVAIPGCAHFCPLDQFSALVEEILPTSDVCNGN